jgi:hypothetical protein
VSANGTKRRKAIADRYQSGKIKTPGFRLRLLVSRELRDNPVRVADDLWHAQPTPGRIRVIGEPAAEARRKEAVEALLAFARAEIAKTGSAAECFNVSVPTDQQSQPIWEFLTLSAFQILVADDPVAMLKRFLGRHHSRPPQDNRERDFTIWGDVQKLHDSGMPIRAVCKEISAAAGLGHDRVLEIYLGERKKREQEKDDPHWQQLNAMLKELGLKRHEAFMEIISAQE